ncbi:MAG: DUF3574 domain-containing protein [Syntrophobacteraceae bacterium]
MHLKRRIPPVFVLVCFMLLSVLTQDTCLAGEQGGAAGHREIVRAQPLSRMVCDTLYFGMSRPQGEVSEEEWGEFVKTVVTPRFPDGFTIYDSQGHWREKNGETPRERAKVLQIVHHSGAKQEKAIREIIADYKRRFDQRSVLRVRSSVQVSF